MPTGKRIPKTDIFDNPVKISTWVDKKTRANIDLLGAKLLYKGDFSYIPTQGQIIDYAITQALKKEKE